MIPGIYNLLKLLLSYYSIKLISGDFGGTQFLYFNFIREFFIQNQALIEKSIEKAKETLSDGITF